MTRSPSQTPTIHIIFTAHLAAVLIGLPWMLTTITRSYHSWLIGWLIFFTMDLFMVLIGGRADRILYSVMFGIRRPQEQRYRHKLVWYLFLLTSYLYASLDSWEDDIQVNRRALKIVAKEIEQDRLSLRAVGRFEFTLRRDIRSEQLRLATAIRNHARSLAMAHSETDYRLIRDSIRAGLLAAVECDWSSLVANTALDNVGTRLSRHLRRFTPSLVLILFAVGIPFLPGVDQNIGASLRLLLLSTALLALVPVGDSTSTTIKEALGKALTPTSKER